MVNVQPVFIKDPLIWQVTLKDQVVNRSPGSAVPVLLGTAGDDGSLIETIQVYPLGDNVATVARFFYQLQGTTGYTLLPFELSLTATSSTGNTTAISGYPLEVVLPKILFPASPTPGTPNRGLRLPAGTQLYTALGTAVATGVIVSCYGGDY